jgi:hypothetical protein
MSTETPNAHGRPGAGIQDELDVIVERSGRELKAAYGRREFGRILRASLPLIALVPLFFLITQLAYWRGGGDPSFLPALLVAALAIGLPLMFAWLGSREARRSSFARSRALGEVDRQLELEGRLQAADDFVQRPLPTGFERAAIDDAALRTEAAKAAVLSHRPAVIDWGRWSVIWAGVGAVSMLLMLLVGTFDVRAKFRSASPDTQVASMGGDVVEAPDDEANDPTRAPELPMPLPLDPGTKNAQARALAEQAEASPDVSESVKESAGKTGAGRSSGALSSSSGSESRSTPSAQGQSSEPGEPEDKAKPKPKKKPTVAPENAAPEEKPEEEESGSTAGKGSSKGSNKNPTASEWKSRDQVTESDDQDIEDDEEAEDDEESQENRGGVQPSLRDRRPPVSRDLQISFGNRSDPDANGRGGPSEQKKSRGVASLVLGVPIPDRIKGRPGPGPTKITQERIEPQAEQPGALKGAQRIARSRPTGPLSTLDLEPSLKALVRRYFLRRRATIF